MKTFTKFILQKLLGIQNYLFIFSLFMIYKLKWDKREKDFLLFLKLIPDDGITLDIGANIGVMSYHLSKKLKHSIVYSFEPIMLNLKNLRKINRLYNLKNNWIMDIALGNDNKQIKMIMPRIGSVRLHGLSHIKEVPGNGSAEGDEYLVEMRKMDDIEDLQNTDKPIRAIKMDVENYEYQVLLGGKNILSKHKPLIYCELWQNENREKCISFLEQLGYSTLVEENGMLVHYNEELHNTQNFFFFYDTMKFSGNKNHN